MIKGSREEHLQKEGPELTEETLEDIAEEELEFLVIDGDEGWEKEEKETAKETNEEEETKREPEKPKRRPQKRKRPRRRPQVVIEKVEDDDTDDTFPVEEETEEKEEDRGIDAEIDGKIYLSELELAQLNYFSEKHRTYEAIQQKNETQLKLLDAQAALMEARREILHKDRIILEYEMAKAARERNEFKMQNRKFLEEIGEKYDGMKGKRWGYNPESGEVIFS